MSDHERNYDFASLLDSAVGLNRIASLEFGVEGLKVGRSHKKQDHVWGKIHPLGDETAPNLIDYSLVANNELVVAALKEGLDVAKEVLCRLQMSPRSSLPAARRRWWITPWEVEVETWPDFVVMTEATLADDSESQVDHRSCMGTEPKGGLVPNFHEMEDPEEDLNRNDELRAIYQSQQMVP
ncbi:unnamed protein product [Calypogeia fissa]